MADMTWDDQTSTTDTSMAWDDSAQATIAPGTVEPEDNVGTSRYADRGFSGHKGIPGLHDAVGQAGAGAVKALDTVMNVMNTGANVPLVMADPARLLDYTIPYVNFGITAAEYITQLGADTVTGAIDQVDDVDITFGRFGEETRGHYPEPTDKVGKFFSDQSVKRKEYVRKFEKDFEKQFGTAPIIETVLGFVPDVLTVGLGSWSNTPKAAAMIEGILGGAHAETAGEDEDMGRVAGAASGYFGTKIIGAFFNRLTPKEVHIMDGIKLSPDLTESHIGLMKFFQDNSEYNYTMSLGEKTFTGNPLVDAHMQKMRDKLGEKMYREYMHTMFSVNGKAKQSIEEASQLFSKGSEELYQVMKRNANNAWDDLANNIPTEVNGVPSIIDSRQLTANIDEALATAPAVIQTFAKKILNFESYGMQIKDITNRQKLLMETLDQDLIGTTAVEAKALRTNYKTKNDLFRSEKGALEQQQLIERTNLTPQRVIDIIKKTTNKKDIKGGNVNTGDGEQLAGLNALRSTLEDALKTVPGIEQFQSQLSHARSSSKDMFDVLGYGNSGKNLGKEVMTPELGKVLGEVPQVQMKIVESLISEKPQVFLTKMNDLKGYIKPEALDTLKKVYLEKKISKSLVEAKGKDYPYVVANRFEGSLGQILDSTDGQNMLRDLYSQDVLDSLQLIRTITGDLSSLAKVGELPKQGWYAYVKGLPNFIKVIMSERAEDYLYVRRQLAAYGVKVDKNWSDHANHQAAIWAGSVAGGALVAPEGDEWEGAAVGGAVARVYRTGSFMSLFMSKASKKFVAEAMAAGVTKAKGTVGSTASKLKGSLKAKIDSLRGKDGK